MRRRHPKHRRTSCVTLSQWDDIRASIGFICLSNGARQVSQWASTWTLKSPAGNISISLGREDLTFSNSGVETIRPAPCVSVEDRVGIYKASLMELFRSRQVQPNEPWRNQGSAPTIQESRIVEPVCQAWPFIDDEPAEGSVSEKFAGLFVAG